MTSSHLSSNPFSMKVFFCVLRIWVRQRKRLAVDISATCTMLMDIDTFIPFLCSHSISIVQSFIAVEMFLLCVIISGTGKKKNRKKGQDFCVWNRQEFFVPFQQLNGHFWWLTITKESPSPSIIHQLNRIIKSNSAHNAVTENYYYYWVCIAPNVCHISSRCLFLCLTMIFPLLLSYLIWKHDY